MVKVMKCHLCGCHMVQTEDKDAELIGGLSFDCSCGYGVFAPKENPNIEEIEEDKIIKATKEQKYKSTLCRILDMLWDYDGCNKVESLKELIDDAREMIKESLKQ